MMPSPSRDALPPIVTALLILTAGAALAATPDAHRGEPSRGADTPASAAPGTADDEEAARWAALAAKARQAEIDTIAGSLLPHGRRRARALGILDRLPLYRIEIEFDPETSRLRGRLHLVVTPTRPIDALHLSIPANANQANVALDEVSLDERRLQFRERSSGRVEVLLPGVAAPGEPLELAMRFSMRVPKEGDHSRSAPLDQLLLQAFSLLGMSPTAASPFAALQSAFSNVPGAAAAVTPSVAGDLSVDTGDVVSLVGFHPELVREKDGVPDLEPAPAFGEPLWGPLANYIVTLVAPPDLEVAGTGRQIGRYPERDGRMRTTRIAAAVRGFALALGREWQVQEAMAGEVRLRAWSSPRSAEQARKLLDVARRAIDHFSRVFGAYPWTDFEIAAVPLGHGLEALAFPNAVFASPLLSDPEVSQLLTGLVPNIMRTSDDALEFSMAHQVAHQWFRGIVGSDGRGAPAVDEGAAVHAALLYVEHRRGARAANARRREQIDGAYRQYRMMSGEDLPLETPLSAYVSAGQVTGLLQGKAAAFHLAAKKRLGRQGYQSAIQRYVARHFFGEATLDDFTFEATRDLAADKAAAFLKMSERFLRQARGDEDIGPPYTVEEALGEAELPPELKAVIEQMFGAQSRQTVAPPAAPPPAEEE